MFIAGHNFSFFFHAVIMRLSSLVPSRSFSRLSVLRILFACDEDDEGMDDFVDTGDDDFPARDLRSPAPDMSISMPSEEDAKSRSDKTRFDEEEVTDSEADADF